MQVEKIADAAQVLGELSDNFLNMPENVRQCVQASLHLEITRTYLLELAKGLTEGKEPYDAMIQAAQGMTRIFP
ncbi:hypothetical protein SAMN05660652_00540 [Propionivibrio dicarboxylicus]|uniref:Uncharacterized protein n=2 Tax=Propionivibrio dicarboxylicus TaxID=83767 RepID=A0A1G7WJS8_9RHOO|nr:hypothetical protein SAMN05660652_00540 [Propionivibrio dicarboxylicus]